MRGPVGEMREVVPLAWGKTSVEIGGPEEGLPVVLIHGFSLASYVWDPTFAALVEAGFRVLRYDLYGRGRSDRPRLRYDHNLFVGQLGVLLDTLDWQAPVRLVGLSMGGPIAAAFAARHPQRVERLALIGPAGAQALTLHPLFRLFVLPLVGDLLFQMLGGWLLMRGNAADFRDPTLARPVLDRFRCDLDAGLKRAVLSSVREGMLGDFAAQYRAVGQLGLPVLLLWGENDPTVPLSHSQLLQEYMPQARLEVILEAGHLPQVERPDLLHPVLLEFLTEQRGPFRTSSSQGATGQ